MRIIPHDINNRNGDMQKNGETKKLIDLFNDKWTNLMISSLAAIYGCSSFAKFDFVKILW